MFSRCPAGLAQDVSWILCRNVLLRQNSSPDGIVHIVMDIGNLVREPDHLPLQSVGMPGSLMV